MRRAHHTPCLLAALALSVAAACGPARAGEAPPDLPLEALLQAEVQTASRKAQRLQDVAAAVFVITRSDIERSGATSIPEALRLAPGVDVARLANNRWAVSARSFNGRFANKLLVLMDGRSLYSPLFSGVLWETEDTLLEDIERIEVIRGPGAALWGANAVNGVINIITRHARDTLGGLAVVGAGRDEKGFVALRHGFALGDGHLRVWAKAFERGTSESLAGGQGNDDWRALRLGLRGDWAFDNSRRLTLSGMVYDGSSGDRWNLPELLSAQGFKTTDIQQDSRSAHLMARHEWLGADGSQVVLQGYVDRSEVDEVSQLNEWRTTADIDFQHRLQLAPVHDFLWGLGYRRSSDSITAAGMLALARPTSTWKLASLFVQDEIEVVPDRWHVLLGTRLDHNSNTGLEHQPNIRITWTPSAEQTLWAAYSGAARTPSRAELDLQVDLKVLPGSAAMPPVLVRSGPPPEGNHLDAEHVRALELGYRRRFGDGLSFNAAAYHNRYEHLRSGRPLGTRFEMQPIPHVVQSTQPISAAKAVIRGLELDLDWRISRTWRLQPSYTYQDAMTESDALDPFQAAAIAQIEAASPHHQFSLLSSLQLSRGVMLDAWLRHTGQRPGDGTPGSRIEAYTTLDLRLAWRPRPGLELSLVGQNLLESRHREFNPDYLPSTPQLVQRSGYAKLRWQY